MTRTEEIKKQLEEVARELYTYDRCYVGELAEARENWNKLIMIINNEDLDIDWCEILPHYNCEGEKLW